LGLRLSYLEYSESESRRFNFRISRAKPFSPDAISAFLAECRDVSAEVVILRGEYSEVSEIFPILQKNCEVYWADTLLEFQKSLNKASCADHLNSGTEIRAARELDRAMLPDLIRRCYKGYRNHYHANPRLNHDLILDGLIEFSMGFLDQRDKLILIASAAGHACGYLCVDLNKGLGSNPIGGSALDMPALRRHKILCDLTHEGDLWLLKNGATRFHAFTRIDKIYIQKLLIRNMHCLPAGSLATLHLNFGG